MGVGEVGVTVRVPLTGTRKKRLGERGGSSGTLTGTRKKSN